MFQVSSSMGPLIEKPWNMEPETWNQEKLILPIYAFALTGNG